AVLFRKQAHQLILAAVGVLILVDHDVSQASIVRFASGVVGLEEAHGFEQEIVEIERVSVAERLLVFLEDCREGLALLVDGVLVKVLRSLLQVLPVADARQGCPILHELLLIQSQGSIGSFDDRELVLIVIDAEAACKTGTNASKGIPIPPQQANAERMEGTD